MGLIGWWYGGNGRHCRHDVLSIRNRGLNGGKGPERLARMGRCRDTELQAYSCDIPCKCWESGKYGLSEHAVSRSHPHVVRLCFGIRVLHLVRGAKNPAAAPRCTF
jgi:hypothetical protein